jgi:hypothetical protein
MAQQLIIEVSDELAALVTQVLTRTYPDVVAGATTPGQVARAVFAWWVASLLAEDAASQTREAGQAQIAAAQQQLETSITAARQQAWDAVNAAFGVAPPIPGEESAP